MAFYLTDLILNYLIHIINKYLLVCKTKKPAPDVGTGFYFQASAARLRLHCAD